MTLDEAICHAKTKAIDLESSGCEQCSKEHQQLADWLEELKQLRNPNSCINGK